MRKFFASISLLLYLNHKTIMVITAEPMLLQLYPAPKTNMFPNIEQSLIHGGSEIRSFTFRTDKEGAYHALVQVLMVEEPR